ncbi:hypothetical protein IGI04_024152 [Brassica rapa subsp. trilocularis]|uniref:Uncharacterized protein n=1 Tax=Brassica rapa subsp. trilocularis TaxID=1813537 RepID=A0ABQ7M5V6_BRACM|nr:hypothetical protein IGI04_024152 [Brassica rapa subsp. trilocularis]
MVSRLPFLRLATICLMIFLFCPPLIFPEQHILMSLVRSRTDGVMVAADSRARRGVTWFLLLINVLLVEMQFTRTCSIFQCFSVNDLYQQSCDYAMSTLDDFSNTSGPVQKRGLGGRVLGVEALGGYLPSRLDPWLIHRLYIVGDKMGHSRADVIILATSKKLLCVSIIYNANVVFVLARLR